MSRISSRYPDSHHHLHQVGNTDPNRRNFLGHLACPMCRVLLETKCDVSELLYHDLQLIDQLKHACPRLYVIDEEECLVQLVVESCGWSMILGVGLKGVESGFL